MRAPSSRILAIAALFVALCAPWFVSPSISVRASVAEPVTVTGWFAIRWLDDFSGREPSVPLYLIQDESGHETMLILSDDLLASVSRMQIAPGHHVTVTGELLSDRGLQTASIWRDYALTEGALPAVVAGSQPFVTILCRFADSSTYEPHPPSFYAPLATLNTYPYPDHYWRELSFGAVDLGGSSSADTWVTLSRPRARTTLPTRPRLIAIGTAT